MTTTFLGVIIRRVFEIQLFYFNQLVFRVKYPYILNFVGIRSLKFGVLTNIFEFLTTVHHEKAFFRTDGVEVPLILLINNLRKGLNYLGKIKIKFKKVSKGGCRSFLCLIFFCSFEIENYHYNKKEHPFPS